jgi:hypothetical protein
MSDEKIPRGVKVGLGYLLAAILAALILMSVVALLGKLQKTETDCWSVQLKDGRTFKVNSCDGTAIELDKKSMEPPKQK